MKLFFVRGCMLGWILLAGAVAVRGAASALTWDALEKSHTAAREDREAVFVFTVTNKSDHPVEIQRTETSCHCTVAAPPRTPWIIAAGASDQLRVVVDLTNRRGFLNKTIYVETSDGEAELLVHVEVPPPPDIQREMNRDVALADRQAVLRGDCASCHVKPAIGARGAELFAAACMICHTPIKRASMVPDLMAPKEKRDAAYWEKIIREGRPKTLMPAFAKENGGFMDEAQVKSLVDFVMAHVPQEPVKPTGEGVVN